MPPVVLVKKVHKLQGKLKQCLQNCVARHYAFFYPILHHLESALNGLDDKMKIGWHKNDKRKRERNAAEDSVARCLSVVLDSGTLPH